MNFYAELLDLFHSEGQILDLKRDEIILKEGQVENHLYFIKSGAVRIFLMTELEETNIRFGYENSILNSLASYLTSTPSEFYIQCLRKSEVLSLERKIMTGFINQSDSHYKAYTNFIEQALAQQIAREIDLLTPSPADRLNRVLERSPNLFQEIPLRHIASYLRMTPETLSRIRKS